MTALALAAVSMVVATGAAGGWPALAGASHASPVWLPLESVVQQTVGSSDTRFFVRRRRALWTASGGEVQSAFGSAGVRLRVARQTVGLRLVGVLAGRRFTVLPPAAPVAARNVVSYPGGSVAEWYRNGPFGLEQGFTINRAPPGAAPAISLELALNGSMRARQTSSGVVFSSPTGAPLLDYRGLSAVDASGRPVKAAVVLRKGRLFLRLWSQRLRYPLHVDPFIQRGAALSGGGESGGAGFGVSVALSADGDTALIGGDSDENNNGAAWVFTRSGSSWVQQGSKLTEPLASASRLGAGLFAASVALSANGDVALIGGPDSNDVGGAAWVFTRSGGRWTSTGKALIPRDESGGAWFGASVALSANGDVALIGGPLDARGPGAAWIFTRHGSTWAQSSHKLTAPGSAFGTSVALSENGTTAMIGGNDAAWAYTQTPHGWAQEGKELTAPGGDFGCAVALSANGDTALIGAYSLNGPGAAWVFTRSRSTWKPTFKLIDANRASGAQFGSSVALSATGTTALISGPLDQRALGAAWVFRRSGATWTQVGAKLTGSPETQGANFGSSVALSANGSTALIGAQYDNQSLGAAWLYQDQR